ncbi:hypothetical protein Tco_1575282 [Tanacetum coccineum]
MEGPRLIEEIGFLAIPRNSLTDALIILEGTLEGFRVQRIYVDGGSLSKIMYEHCFKGFDAAIKSRLRKSNAPLVGFSGEIYHPVGLIDLRVTMSELGKNKTVLVEFAIVKCCSPYNVFLGRTRMGSFGVERNTMALAHGANVKDKGTCHIEEPGISGRRLRKEPMVSEGSWEEYVVKEKVVIHNDYPDQPVVINDKLSIECK